MNTMNNAGTGILAVVFSRFGPYHLARLNGARMALERAGGGLAAIAVAASDRVYAWSRIDESLAHSTRVLFPNQDYETVPEKELSVRLHQLLDEINPLVVALPGWAFVEARAGLAWCRRRQRAAVLMSESSHADHFRLWPREIIKQYLVRQFGAALVGGRCHAEYARKLGLPQAAIFTGYDAVDNNYFACGADKARSLPDETRRSLSLPPRYVLSSSRFVQKKNIDGLLRGYALYRSQNPAAPDLVICGDGELRDSLHQLADLLNLSGHVHWPGFVQYPLLPAYYALADAFILASTTEQWGLVVNEAMACGLPVLVSHRCGCHVDLVREGENGFTFDAYQPDAIAQAFARVPADPMARARMGERSREIIAGFTPQIFGENLLQAARLALARLGREDLGPPGVAA